MVVVWRGWGGKRRVVPEKENTFMPTTAAVQTVVFIPRPMASNPVTTPTTTTTIKDQGTGKNTIHRHRRRRRGPLLLLNRGCKVAFFGTCNDRVRPVKKHRS